jgi:hypothetical protein
VPRSHPLMSHFGHRRLRACRRLEESQNRTMRNPDHYSPMDPDDSGASKPVGGDGDHDVRDTRRVALAGLVIVVLLIAGGLVLTRVLHGMAQVQDCALSGRSNCT